ncbi:hypothetical protein KW803_03095 [Candidatus Saccharibacteria bacterium]|nr:hypothetical protein [Candidatus Saccharibacteria bacterium]
MSEAVNNLEPAAGNVLNLFERMEQRDRVLGKVALDYEDKNWIGRKLLLRKTPGLQDFMDYKRAQQSIADAKRSAQ